jgi:signal transduction histidine kinase
LLNQPGIVSWNQPGLLSIYRTAIDCGALAAGLATRTGKAVPELAWVAGVLAPVGWFAVGAVDADAAASCLNDPAHIGQPAATQRQYWGLDAGAIARRLARRWQLPPWLTAVVGHLTLAPETARTMGADENLFRIVQLAVGLAAPLGGQLDLVPTVPMARMAEYLGLPDVNDFTTDVVADCGEEQQPSPPIAPTLAEIPWLRALLLTAAEHRRVTDVPVIERLERDNDELHRALTEQCSTEERRLRALNLSTLAEFAAGAGHEINNPLAVISGQAQYLLGREADPARQKSLQTIVGQAQRIHDILTQLMRFARPARPQKQLIDLVGVARDVALSLTEFAAERKVQLRAPEPTPAINGFIDPKQLCMALAALLRNAIEAAPADGWASIQVVAQAQTLDIVVDDSGPGLTPQQREHMFDPFYSGRQAGRGRGLGLPTAWRLARENGAEVFLDEQVQANTRFVFRVPRDIAWDEALATGHAPHGPNGHTARQPAASAILPG